MSLPDIFGNLPENVRFGSRFQNVVAGNAAGEGRQVRRVNRQGRDHLPGLIPGPVGGDEHHSGKIGPAPESNDPGDENSTGFGGGDSGLVGEVGGISGFEAEAAQPTGKAAEAAIRYESKGTVRQHGRRGGITRAIPG